MSSSCVLIRVRDWLKIRPTRWHQAFTRKIVVINLKIFLLSKTSFCSTWRIFINLEAKLSVKSQLTLYDQFSFCPPTVQHSILIDIQLVALSNLSDLSDLSHLSDDKCWAWGLYNVVVRLSETQWDSLLTWNTQKELRMSDHQDPDEGELLSLCWPCVLLTGWHDMTQHGSSRGSHLVTELRTAKEGLQGQNIDNYREIF